MFELFGVIFTIAPLVASIIAAVYAYKAYRTCKAGAGYQDCKREGRAE